MYYTKHAWSGSIERVEMDGSNPVTIVPGQRYPFGVAINLDLSKLFWMQCREGEDKRIKYSNFQGGAQRTIVDPFIDCESRIVVANERIYWADSSNFGLRSIPISGGNSTLLFTEKQSIRAITLVLPDFSFPQNRVNDCASLGCAKVCALTASSARCLT